MLKREVLSDIEKCNEILEKKDIESAKKYINIIVGTYGDYISGIKDGLQLYNLYSKTPPDYLENIEILKRKLEVFAANGCTPTHRFKSSDLNKAISINNNNANTNTNTNTIDLKISFEQAKNAIESDESLSEEEIKEVLEKIEEIEVVSNSNEPRNKKWFKLKGIMGWLGTKGVSVATTLLPLITEIIKYNNPS